MCSLYYQQLNPYKTQRYDTHCQIGDFVDGNLAAAKNPQVCSVGAVTMAGVR